MLHLATCTLTHQYHSIEVILHETKILHYKDLQQKIQDYAICRDRGYLLAIASWMEIFNFKGVARGGGGFR